MFKPTFWLESVFQIDEVFLYKNNIHGLILDLDNTLSMHDNPKAEEGVIEWLDEMRFLKIKMIVVSNNSAKRVAPLAEELGLDFISFGCKPLPFGIYKAARSLNLSRFNLAVVGDQIFTDIIGGNYCGIRTVLVEPFHLEDKWTFRLKRKIESVVFERDFTKL
ncbi:MAG: YqeG family HAD IIIA-type phosphatase [Oscillospiraceae bacterium]|nr:YqeG family HAD IIIA-type phosphatase [Oscillospiraceae bacterium]